MKRQKCDVVNLDNVHYTKQDAATFWKLLNMQKKLAADISFKKKLDLLLAINGDTSLKRRLEWADHLLTCMSQEIAETRDYLPWKSWKNYKDYDYKKVEKELRYEVVDILHFWLELCLVLGISGTDIVKYYFAKCWQNHQRQRKGY